jgi:N-acetylmuramic acid 6-phosphate etherase
LVQTKAKTLSRSDPPVPDPEQTSLDALPTEGARAELADLDTWPTSRLVGQFITDHDAVTRALTAAAGQLAAAADLVAAQLAKGGRLIYAGAGTGGRLAALDAAEIGPSYGLTGRVVVAFAGGVDAMLEGREFYEDDAGQGAAELRALAPTSDDVVVGVSASGRTPYVLGAVEAAAAAGAPTVALVCAPGAPLAALADLAVEIDTGAEMVSGSTRLKAGAAQKVALNTLSTIAMVRLGRTYGNLMVDVVADNAKLRRRAVRAVAQATGVGDTAAAAALDAAGGDAKAAIVSLLAGLPPDRAKEALAAAQGRIRVALGLAGNPD